MLAFIGRENTNSKEAGEFGRRLREVMRAAGLVSDSSRSGVDVGALAALLSLGILGDDTVVETLSGLGLALISIAASRRGF